MYDGRWPSLENTLFVLIVSLVTVILGYAVFKRYEGRLAEEL
jgi:ABC-type polysaccharide/polyol phosphate export permease